MALVLVAAASELDAGFERLKTMPASERTRLLESLRRFDLQLSPEQKTAARDIDRRLAEMTPTQRAHYLAVLRRYHSWLNTLPEQRQDELTAGPTGDRMTLVRTLMRERPVPTGDTPPALRVIEPGEYTPFEVASAYRIWQLLSEGQRMDMQKSGTERARREALFRIGERPKIAIPRETLPEDFDEEKWIGEVRTLWGPPLRSIALLEDAAKTKVVDAIKKRIEAVRPEFVRRQAINLYVSRSERRSVDPERLDRFIAELPPWIPASFDSLAPDEARSRMAFAYRLVFPQGQEIGAPRKSGTATVKTKGVRSAGPRVGPPAKAKTKPAQAGENPTPF